MISRFAIRPAESAADLADAARLFRSYAASLPIDLSYQGFEAELAGLPGKYAPPAGALLIARNEHETAIGCVALRPIDGDGVCEMKRLYVTPDARGMGLGDALIARIVASARASAYAEMRLDTLPTMLAALGLYIRAGFREIPAYYPTPIAGTVFLGLTL